MAKIHSIPKPDRDASRTACGIFIGQENAVSSHLENVTCRKCIKYITEYRKNQEIGIPEKSDEKETDIPRPDAEPKYAGGRKIPLPDIILYQDPAVFKPAELGIKLDTEDQAEEILDMLLAMKVSVTSGKLELTDQQAIIISKLYDTVHYILYPSVRPIEPDKYNASIK